MEPRQIKLYQTKTLLNPRRPQQSINGFLKPFFAVVSDVKNNGVTGA